MSALTALSRQDHGLCADKVVRYRHLPAHLTGGAAMPSCPARVYVFVCPPWQQDMTWLGVLRRLMDSADDVQGLGKGVKRRFKKRTSSKAITIHANSQLPVTCLQVCLHASPMIGVFHAAVAKPSSKRRLPFDKTASGLHVL